MNIRHFLVALSFCLLLGGLATTGVYAAPKPCGAFQPQPNTTDPDNDPAFCKTAFANNDIVWINSSVPFAWLRDRPANKAVATVMPKRERLRIDVLFENERTNPKWDGVQWWYYVHGVDNPALTRWVEQTALEIAGTVVPTPVKPGNPANWRLPARARAMAGVPFIWLRRFPESNGEILVTILPGQRFTVLSAPAASWDGVQWWWDVEYTFGNQTYRGWIEQASIRVY
jgi:hypothetical protein